MMQYAEVNFRFVSFVKNLHGWCTQIDTFHVGMWLDNFI